MDNQELQRILDLPPDELSSFVDYLKGKHPYDRSKLEQLVVRVWALAVFMHLNPIAKEGI